MRRERSLLTCLEPANDGALGDHLGLGNERGDEGGLLESDLSLGEDATVHGSLGLEGDAGGAEDDALEVGAGTEGNGVGDGPDDVGSVSSPANS